MKTNFNSKKVILIGLDLICIFMAQILSLFLRFSLDKSIPKIYLDNVLSPYTLVLMVVTILVFAAFKMYSRIWRSASVLEMVSLIFSVFISSALNVVGMALWGRLVLKTTRQMMPVSYYLFYLSIFGTLVFITRFSRRIFHALKNRYFHKESPKTKVVMVVGAGQAGEMLIRELLSSQYINCRIACIVDDDKEKWGNFLSGCKVEGGREDIPELVKKHGVTDIYIAIPSASSKEQSKILDICKETGCKMKTLPGLYQFVNGDLIASKLRDVAIEDLLGREPIKVDMKAVMECINNKVVLVTGGGGSIGSELCRQIARNNPKQLIIVDIYENNAYEIQQELIRNHPELNLEVLIASVRNTRRINKIFETYKPQVVYHAAAHKHVPLMEVSPNEAIKNNVFGTLKTVKAADANGVERFVLISTDKAVNPTNIMGATKRICEMIVQMFNRHSKTEFVAVRFGNVLGSNGSVISLFKKQIEEGGPVKVTHPDIIRYFMTIPEAVTLVIHASAYAKGGEIFVLDMGEPVKILDLAKNLIRLSGFTPDKDIKIEFTGLRPGEKLYEELLMDEEGLQDTENKLIHIGKPIEIDEEKFKKQLEELYKASLQEPDDVRRMVKEIVTTYHPDND